MTARQLPRLVPLALAAASLAGCVGRGDWKPAPRLEPQSLTAQQTLAGARLEPKAWPAQRWWHGYGDPQLDTLVDEALAFARQAGYKRITLSTYDILASARRIYQAAGFTLVHEEPERAFGRDLTAQEWARDLQPSRFPSI